MKIHFWLFVATVGCLALASCDPSLPEKAKRGDLPGFVPVYSTDVTSLKKITALPPQPTVNGGKLYVTGNLLFQVEQDSGIHIINYTNPSNPQKIGFIKSFLCKEVSVKNGYIYTNNLDDLVVVDINNLSTIKEVGRTKNVFPDLLIQYPPKPADDNSVIYFECPNSKNGTIIAWKKQILTNPKCSR